MYPPSHVQRGCRLEIAQASTLGVFTTGFGSDPVHTSRIPVAAQLPSSERLMILVVPAPSRLCALAISGKITSVAERISQSLCLLAKCGLQVDSEGLHRHAAIHQPRGTNLPCRHAVNSKNGCSTRGSAWGWGAAARSCTGYVHNCIPSCSSSESWSRPGGPPNPPGVAVTNQHFAKQPMACPPLRDDVGGPTHQQQLR